jgi:hypothetical protein
MRIVDNTTPVSLDLPVFVTCMPDFSSYQDLLPPTSLEAAQFPPKADQISHTPDGDITASASGHDDSEAISFEKLDPVCLL